MASMTDYLENKLIDHLFRARSFTAPSQLYVGLFTAAPSDAGGGTEVSGGSYGRATPGVNSDTAWKATQGGTPASASSGTGGQTSNPGTLTFPAPTANWGSVTHFGVFDASTAGNLLFHGALTVAKTVNNGDPAPTAVADAITVTLA
jgi:hypothetical protein